jgi:predicted amidohydrolase
LLHGSNSPLAGAQTGPIQRTDPRARTLDRLIALLEQAARAGARLVVFPELALTTFFPRWLLSDPERDAFFEREMPNPDCQALFDRARELSVGFYLGFAELTAEGHRFNTAITVGPDGVILGKYRKVHLPGSVEPRPASASSSWRSGTSSMATSASPLFAARPSGTVPCSACSSAMTAAGPRPGAATASRAWS